MEGMEDISSTLLLSAGNPMGEAVVFHCCPGASVISCTFEMTGLGLRTSISTSSVADSEPDEAVTFTLPIPCMFLILTSNQASCSPVCEKCTTCAWLPCTSMNSLACRFTLTDLILFSIANTVTGNLMVSPGDSTLGMVVSTMTGFFTATAFSVKP